jgi:hypothetical protein
VRSRSRPFTFNVRRSEFNVRRSGAQERLAHSWRGKARGSLFQGSEETAEDEGRRRGGLGADVDRCKEDALGAVTMNASSFGTLNAEGRTINVERSLLACFEETFELADAGGVAHFAERFGFDLTDSFAGDAELSAHLFERSAVTVDQAEPLFENLTLAFG